MGVSLLKVAEVVGIGAAITVLGADIILSQQMKYNNDYVEPILRTYPSDLPKNQKVAAMIFQFYEYDRPSILNPPKLISLGSIALPLPSELTDTLSEHYNADAPGLAIGGLMESISGKNNLISKSVSAFQTGMEGLAAQGAENLTEDIGGQKLVNEVLSFGGIVQNPFLSMLFKSPDFKRFVFTWTFNPETPGDSDTLNFILKKLRYHAMPGYNPTGAGSILNYPDMCVPIILPSGYMFDFKQCVIEGISINYVPGDMPAFFDSTMAPTSIKLTISLIEIEYWLKPDMTNFQAPGGLSSLTQAQQQASLTNGIGHN